MKQLDLGLQERFRWGGRRPGAGRKPDPNSGMPHGRRARFPRGRPCHVTIKVREDVPSLRRKSVVKALEKTWRAGCERGEFRLAHYSIQTNHVHLIVEATGPAALGRGMMSIGARFSKAVNRVLGRRGPVVADRYHVRVLKTPREVRTALAYVLLNARRHAAQRRRTRLPQGLDPASSGRWFEGWKVRLARPPDPPAVAAAHSWLMRLGWRRHGRISFAEVPG